MTFESLNEVGLILHIASINPSPKETMGEGLVVLMRRGIQLGILRDPSIRANNPSTHMIQNNSHPSLLMDLYRVGSTPLPASSGKITAYWPP